MKLDTVFPADSVEFCSVPGFHDILACGTYKLLEEHQSSEATHEKVSSPKRIGKCILLKVQDEERIDILQQIDMPAILDMKWSPSSKWLAIADSEGHISLHELDENCRLRETQNIQSRPNDTLCLSLDWSNRRDTSGTGNIAVSSSDGSLSILQPNTTGSFAESRSWHAHDFEAWITAWNYWNTNLVYSGGDDLKLKGWDVRQDDHSPTFINKKFDAGVTSIQSHPHKENILAVGSYDATVRIFDTRKPLVPITQADVGGGAWRVKWHPSPSRCTDLLVACMHDGFKVVRFSPSVVTSPSEGQPESAQGRGWEIIKRFDAHESLAYGVDWSYGGKVAADSGDTLIASCSFYDHVLNTWTG